jgi:HPt (histidine-containing phosphotransfer) domain-containing protein
LFHKRSSGLGNTDKGSDSSSPQSPGPNPKNSSGWEHLVSEYLSALPRQLNSIRAILEIPNYEKIKQQAHRIKGTSGTYGLDVISQDAAQLEQSAEAHDAENVALALGRIIKSVQTQNSAMNTQSAAAVDSPERAANA